MKLTWYHPENLFGVIIDYSLSVRDCWNGVAKAFAVHNKLSQPDDVATRALMESYSISGPLFAQLEEPRPNSTTELLDRWEKIASAIHPSWRKHLNVRLFVQLTAVDINTRAFLLADELAAELRTMSLRSFIYLQVDDLQKIKRKSHSRAMAISTS